MRAWLARLLLALMLAAGLSGVTFGQAGVDAADVAGDAATQADAAVDAAGPAIADDDGIADAAAPAGGAAPAWSGSPRDTVRMARERARSQLPRSERILDFDSTLAVQANGDLLVTETLKVLALGQEIRRGILREFPTRYALRNGAQVTVGFEVLGVRRDGENEPHDTEMLANGVRVRIGSGERLLAPGVHTYEIRYRTTRQIGFFDDADELYWNVTGTGWTLPIDHAQARIVLPQPAAIQRSAFYTGPDGSTARDARVVAQGPGEIVFATTAPLAAREGLTVAAAWPKGIVAPPSRGAVTGYWLRDNVGTLVGVIGFVALGLYYVVAWRRTRRPDTPVIVPRFEPPAGMSAAAVRYVAMPRHDDPVFLAAMFELVATGALRMQPKGTHTEYVPGTPPANSQLEAVWRKLFRKGKAFVRDGREGQRFGDARGALEARLRTEYDTRMFVNNARIAWIGLLGWVLYLVAALGAAWLQNPYNVGWLAFGSLFGAIGVGAGTAMVALWRSGGGRGFAALFFLMFAVPFTLAGLGVMLGVARPFPIGALPTLLVLAIFPVVLRAFHFLDAYTPLGYRTLDEIAGLKRYLTVAEAPRLRALASPQEKLALYERFLPYAVALGVAQAWAAMFADAFLDDPAALTALHDMQERYGGHDVMRDDPGRASGLIGDLAPATPASSSAPGSSGSWSGGGGSSSGSSGGGSSGGGGGGGGGSGW